MPWLPSTFFLRGSNGTLNFLICCRLAWHNANIYNLFPDRKFNNLTNVFTRRATISSHHCELLLHNDRENRLQFNKGNNCPLVYPLLYMIGAAREKLTPFMTSSLDTNPCLISDVCGLNLQYHCKTVSRQSKVYSVGLRRLWNKKNQQAKPYYR